VVSLSEDRVSHELAVCRPEENPTESRPPLTLGSWLGTTKLARKQQRTPSPSQNQINECNRDFATVIKWLPGIRREFTGTE